MNIALMGYGRMGRAVEAVAAERGHRIVLRLEEDGDVVEAGLPGVSPPSDAEASEAAPSLDSVDVAIDFSVAEAVPGNVARAAEAGVPVVVGTTGWSDREAEVRRAVEAAGIGFLHAPNFSLGALLFYRLAELAGSLVGPYGDYDVHLTEMHHRHKRDHPSGTARRLADLLVGVLPTKERWAEGPGDPDDPGLLGVTSIRVGEATGTHLVGLDGPDDRIEIRHEARSRNGFARGAVEAAEWLEGRRGWFTLDDLLADRLARVGAARKPGAPSGGAEGGTGDAGEPGGSKETER